jgi:dolichyl-phosphate-mannose-protein mannosyltransferase
MQLDVATATDLEAPNRTSGLARHLPLLILLGAGLAFRLVAAYAIFPNQGYAGDLGLFQSWATTLARVGPGAFYASASSANYPPGYLYVLWAIGIAGGPLGTILGVSSETAVGLLLKLPAIAADIGIALLVFRAADRWFGGRSGLIAAALYLFIPVTWYDSALWGQVDAVGALVMLGALLLLIEGWSEPALAMAVAGVMVKPQDLICLVIVVPVLVRRHLIRVGSGPRPRLGPRLQGLDRRLGGLLVNQGPIRLATAGLVASVTAIVLLLPFDIANFAPAALADVPILGHLAGLVGLLVAVGGQFSVLTANAYNGWALVGPDPLVSVIDAGTGSWTTDSLLVFAGIPAVTIGTVLLAAVGLLVAGGLLARDGRLPILLGFTLLAFAFYALPTRVHERYLFPFFTTGAILAAGAAVTVAAYLVVGVLNAINLHAVLAGSLRIGAGGPNGVGFGRGGGGDFGGGRFGSIQLPLAELARSEPVVALVVIGQTAAFIGLLVAWLVVLVRAPRPTTPSTAGVAPVSGSDFGPWS